MSPHVFAEYVVATFVVVILPGPIVTLVIANSLAHGTRAGLVSVAGNQLGLMVVFGVVAAGLISLVAALGSWFEWVRLAGALYLVWLGWKLLRSPGDLARSTAAPRPRGGFFWQAFLISISNPKTLLFVGAFLPQFVDPRRPYLFQVLVMCLTFMGIAAICDGTYAVLSGRAGAWLSEQRVRWVSRVSGAFLIGGGAWLAFSRSRS